MTSSVIAQYIGKRIREERQRQKLSQEKLAEKAKISRTHMERVERGIINLPVATLYKISKALKTKSSDLLPF